MCLIVFNPHGNKLPEDRMRVAFDNNPHGFGFMWNEDGRAKMIKDDGTGGIEKFMELMEFFRGVPHAIHLRWRTHGAISEAGSHPHVILSKDRGDAADLLMMHNGTFSGLPSDPVKSDTMILAERLREELKDNGGQFNKAVSKFSKNIGLGNRVLFLNSQGKAIFLNAGLGFWDSGVWYSNTYSFHGLEYSLKPVTHYTLVDGKLIPRSSVGNGVGMPVEAPKAVPAKVAKVHAKDAPKLAAKDPAKAEKVKEPKAKSSPVSDSDDKVIWPPSSSKLVKEQRQRHGKQPKTNSKVLVLRGTGTIPPPPVLWKQLEDAKREKSLANAKLAKRAKKLERRAARKFKRAQAKQMRCNAAGQERSVKIFTVQPVKVKPAISEEYPPQEARLISNIR